MEDGKQIVQLFQVIKRVYGVENISTGEFFVNRNSRFSALITFCIQLVPSLLVLLPGFSGGAAISYVAVALPHYMDPDNDSGLVMTEDQATWFGEC